jgi:hypothetical protein
MAFFIHGPTLFYFPYISFYKGSVKSLRVESFCRISYLNHLKEKALNKQFIFTMQVTNNVSRVKGNASHRKTEIHLPAYVTITLYRLCLSKT